MLFFLFSITMIAALRSFTLPRHLKNVAPPLHTFLRKNVSFQYSPLLPCNIVEKRQKQLFFDGCSQPCSWKGPAGDAALTIGMMCRPEKEDRAGSTNAFNALCWPVHSLIGDLKLTYCLVCSFKCTLDYALHKIIFFIKMNITCCSAARKVCILFSVCRYKNFYFCNTPS